MSEESGKVTNTVGGREKEKKNQSEQRQKMKKQEKKTESFFGTGRHEAKGSSSTGCQQIQHSNIDTAWHGMQRYIKARCTSIRLTYLFEGIYTDIESIK